MQTPDTTIANANRTRWSLELLALGPVLLLCAGLNLISFSVASGRESDDFWTPASVALSMALVPPFFIPGFLLSILSFPAFASYRIRPITISAMLIFLALVWYPLQGHDTLMLYLHTQEQAFLYAGQRNCALPITDL